MKKLFTDHPRSMGESYWQHMGFACLFGFNMLMGGIVCIIHAIFPFVFKKTGSNILLKMVHHFVERAPLIESRIQNLSRAIQEKMEKEPT